jgi:hypothetical protein
VFITFQVAVQVMVQAEPMHLPLAEPPKASAARLILVKVKVAIQTQEQAALEL